MPGRSREALLPGPLTLVLPNPAWRFQWLTGARPDTIGVRVPELVGDTKAIVKRIGAVAATSANLTGGPDPKSLDEVLGRDSRGRGRRHRWGRAARDPFDGGRPDRPGAADHPRGRVAGRRGARAPRPAGLRRTIPTWPSRSRPFSSCAARGSPRSTPRSPSSSAREHERQRGQIELIASENFTWPSIFEAVGSVPTNKYAEGYPGKRYYGGCEVIDEIEQTAIDRALSLFGAEHANVQPHAGAQTNMAVYLAALDPGDTILSLELSHGGHLTHGLKVNFSGRLYTIVHYGVSRETNVVDYDEVLRLAKQHRPKLIICGGSAYPRTVEADKFREVADEVGALLLCDMAHFAGLVAAGLHPSPVPHCDFVTSTTHKTLAGPRAGFILCKEEHAKAVDRAVFPGMQGGPLCHVIAAKAACFKIAASEAFKDYQRQVRANADTLAETIQAGGLDVLTGGTDTHLLQVDLRKTDWTGKDAEERLAEVKITVNRNTDPVRRASSDRRLRHPGRDAGHDDARLRRGGLHGGRRDRRRRARGLARPGCADRTQRGALRQAAALPGLPRLHLVRVSTGAAAGGGGRARLGGRRRPRHGAVVEVDHPLVRHKLSYLRDKRTSTGDFRRLVHELTALLTYEATKDLPTETVRVETPLEWTEVERISGKKVAVCPVLRAGVGMLDGFLGLVEGARVGFIGLFRDEETLEPIEYYVKLPSDLGVRDAIVLDPMLATGNSCAAAVSAVKEAGARSVRLICLVAAPEGILRVHSAHPDVPIFCAAIDQGLNERGYIVPGLGDAGDRLYGTK